MKKSIKKFIRAELDLSHKYEGAGYLQASWQHLERAHILSQPYAWLHIYVHIKMILFSLRRGNFKEVIAQIPRILLAGPGSLFGLAPKGNTGGGNVGIFTPMEIPEYLRKILEAKASSRK